MLFEKLKSQNEILWHYLNDVYKLRPICYNMLKGYKYDKTSQKYKVYNDRRRKKMEQKTWERLDKLNKKTPTK